MIPDTTAARAGRMLLWRWHGIAGLLVAPLLLILALTGAVYLFRWEVDRWCHPTLFAPVVGTASATYAQQLQAVAEAFPSYQAESVAIDPEHAWPTEVVIRDLTGATRTVLVDPATAHVRGSLADDQRWTAIAIHVHRDLFAGTPGRVLLELAASWAVILVLSGVWLWWPVTSQRVQGLFVPSQGRDLRWWHVTPGVVLAPAMLMLVLSGLPWTVVWGRLYEQATTALGSGFPSEVFWQRPRSALAASTSPLSIDDVLHAVEGRGFPTALVIDLPRTVGESWVIHGQMGRDPLRSRWTFVDPHDGRILYERSWADIGTLARPATIGVSLHMGLLFGPWNRLLCLAGCIGIAAAAISGPLLWWQRRRRGMHLPRVTWRDLPRRLWLAVVIVLALLPVAAVGAVVVVLISWVWQKVERA